MLPHTLPYVSPGTSIFKKKRGPSFQGQYNYFIQHLIMASGKFAVQYQTQLRRNDIAFHYMI
jgi:hypothetical protein